MSSTKKIEKAKHYCQQGEREIDSSDFTYDNKCYYCDEELISTTDLVAHIYEQLTEDN